MISSSRLVKFKRYKAAQLRSLRTSELRKSEKSFLYPEPTVLPFSKISILLRNKNFWLHIGNCISVIYGLAKLESGFSKIPDTGNRAGGLSGEPADKWEQCQLSDQTTHYSSVSFPTQNTSQFQFMSTDKESSTTLWMAGQIIIPALQPPLICVHDHLGCQRLFPKR